MHEPDVLDPVVAVFFQSSRLTFAKMLLLQSASTAVTLAVDVPTSVLSDLVGRRRLLQALTLVAARAASLPVMA